MRWKRPAREWGMLAAACVLISASWVCLRFLRLSWLERILEPRGACDMRGIDAWTARVAQAVLAASRHAPGSSCLTQAYAAKALLRWRGVPSQVRIGVARDGETGLRAHAWLESNGSVVLGEAASPGRFQEVRWRPR